jgi:hypothetical protein
LVSKYIFIAPNKKWSLLSERLERCGCFFCLFQQFRCSVVDLVDGIIMGEGKRRGGDDGWMLTFAQ